MSLNQAIFPLCSGSLAFGISAHVRKSEKLGIAACGEDELASYVCSRSMLWPVQLYIPLCMLKIHVVPDSIV
jgi:hypothetical protein